MVKNYQKHQRNIFMSFRDKSIKKLGQDMPDVKPVEKSTAALQVGSVKQEPDPRRDTR